MGGLQLAPADLTSLWLGQGPGRTVGQPLLDFGLVPANRVGAELDLPRKCAFAHAAIDRRPAKSGTILDDGDSQDFCHVLPCHLWDAARCRETRGEDYFGERLLLTLKRLSEISPFRPYYRQVRQGRRRVLDVLCSCALSRDGSPFEAWARPAGQHIRLRLRRIERIRKPAGHHASR